MASESECSPSDNELKAFVFAPRGFLPLERLDASLPSIISAAFEDAVRLRNLCQVGTKFKQKWKTYDLRGLLAIPTSSSSVAFGTGAGECTRFFFGTGEVSGLQKW